MVIWRVISLIFLAFPKEGYRFGHTINFIFFEELIFVKF